jgi:hypothetical protein
VEPLSQSMRGYGSSQRIEYVTNSLALGRRHSADDCLGAAPNGIFDSSHAPGGRAAAVPESRSYRRIAMAPERVVCFNHNAIFGVTLTPA